MNNIETTTNGPKWQSWESPNPVSSVAIEQFLNTAQTFGILKNAQFLLQRGNEHITILEN